MSAILDGHIAEFQREVDRRVTDPHARANMKAKIRIVAEVARREEERKHRPTCNCKADAPAS